MKDDRNVDAHFKHFRDAEAKTPMHLWPAIARRMWGPSRHRRYLLLWLAGALVLAGGLANYAGRNGRKLSIHPMVKDAASIVPVAPAAKPKTPVASSASAEMVVVSGVERAQALQPAVPATHRRRTIAAKKAAAVSPVHGSSTVPEADARITAPPDRSAAAQQPKGRRRVAHSTLASLPRLVPHLAGQQPEPSVQWPPEASCSGTRKIHIPAAAYLELYAGGTKAEMFFEPKAPEYKALARLRDSTERAEWGSLAGIRLGYTHKSGLSARAGLMVQRMRAVFDYTIAQDEKMIITIHRDDSGNIIGRDTTYERGMRHLHIHNKYTTVDVPLSIGYISSGKQVQLGLFVGAALNMKFDVRGKYVDAIGTIRSLDGQALYKNRIGVSFFGAVQAHYFLADRWGVFVEPQLRFFPSDFSTALQNTRHKAATFNVLGGLRYVF